MAAPRAETVFRLSGLMACIVIAVPRLMYGMPTVPEGLRHPMFGRLSEGEIAFWWWVILLFWIAFVGALGAAFWTVTGHAASRRRKIILLAVQALIVMGDADFLILLAAQLPFALQPAGAIRWLIVQLSLFTVMVIVSPERIDPNQSIGRPPLPATPWAIGYALGWQAFSFGVGYLAASERRARAELEQRNRELLAAEAILSDTTRLAERARISRELHDTIGHHLTVLSVNLELIHHVAGTRAADAVHAAQTVTRLMLADVRDVVTTLHEERVVDVKRALSMLSNSEGPPAVHVSVAEAVDVRDPASANALFRCAQEGITNAMRYAQARNVWVDLTPADGGVELRVRDDGRGAASVRLGNGLRGMRERVEEIGGRLDFTTAAGAGFSICAWIPDPEAVR